jgi:6,7-dimethyl-8-ribityllumazine synthase
VINVPGALPEPVVVPFLAEVRKVLLVVVVGVVVAVG